MSDIYFMISTPCLQHLYRLDLNYDPEGVLGSLNSIVLCYFGVQAGRTLLHFRGKHLSVFVRFIIWGLSLVREYSKPPNNGQVQDSFLTFVERLALLKYYRKGHFVPFSLAVVESLVTFRSPLRVNTHKIQSSLGNPARGELTQNAMSSNGISIFIPTRVCTGGVSLSARLD